MKVLSDRSPPSSVNTALGHLCKDLSSAENRKHKDKKTKGKEIMPASPGKVPYPWSANRLRLF